MWNNTDIPCEDIKTWVENKNLRKFYDKMYVASLQGLQHGLHGIPISKFPVISKPISNLDGMGFGAEKWNCSEDVIYRPGHFWCEYLEGDHVSYDLYYDGSSINAIYKAVGFKYQNNPNIFALWTITKEECIPENQTSFLSTYIIPELSKSIKINLECINHRIIEIHFRHCPDWEKMYAIDDKFYGIPIWSEVSRRKRIENTGNFLFIRDSSQNPTNDGFVREGIVITDRIDSEFFNVFDKYMLDNQLKDLL